VQDTDAAIERQDLRHDLSAPARGANLQQGFDAAGVFNLIFVSNRFPEVAAVSAELALDCCVG
jgi:hypothetical protein